VTLPPRANTPIDRDKRAPAVASNTRTACKTKKKALTFEPNPDTTATAAGRDEEVEWSKSPRVQTPSKEKRDDEKDLAIGPGGDGPKPEPSSNNNQEKTDLMSTIAWAGGICHVKLGKKKAGRLRTQATYGEAYSTSAGGPLPRLCGKKPRTGRAQKGEATLGARPRAQRKRKGGGGDGEFQPRLLSEPCIRGRR